MVEYRQLRIIVTTTTLYILSEIQDSDIDRTLTLTLTKLSSPVGRHPCRAPSSPELSQSDIHGACSVFPPLTAISRTSLSDINKIHYAQYLSYTCLYTDYELQIKTS